MKPAFERYKAGEELTLNLFREMCKAHDLTYNYSDDSRAYNNGRDEYKLIEEAAAKLPKSEAAHVWNQAVVDRVLPDFAAGYLW